MQLYFFIQNYGKRKNLSTLTEKLGKTSFSQKTLETYVGKHLPSEGTEPDDAYWALHTEVLKTLEGQYNHDVAEAVEEAKKNFATPQNPNSCPFSKTEFLSMSMEDFFFSSASAFSRASRRLVIASSAKGVVLGFGLGFFQSQSERGEIP